MNKFLKGAMSDAEAAVGETREWVANRASYAGPDKRYYVQNRGGLRLYLDVSAREGVDEQQAIAVERILNADHEAAQQLAQALEKETWVVCGPELDEGKRGQWWYIEREGKPYGADGKAQQGAPFGNFISRKWAQATADYVNGLERKLVITKDQSDIPGKAWKMVLSTDLGFGSDPDEYTVIASTLPDGDDYINYLSKVQAEVIIADHGAAQKLARWHEVMIDVSDVTWTLSKDNAADLYKQLYDVIAQTIQIQLDPVVSEQARQLAQALQERDAAWAEHKIVHDKLRLAEERLTEEISHE